VVSFVGETVVSFGETVVSFGPLKRRFGGFLGYQVEAV
jgi:hypothetical protein